MPSFANWHNEPDEIQTRLAAIGGLTVAILHEAATQGELARADCTANHPPLAAAFNAWADTTRSLRDQLLPRGWMKSDEGNYAIVVSPDGQFAVVVASGDENTGSLILPPKTKSPKGPRTYEIVSQNAVQLHLFEEVSDDEIRAALIAGTASNRLTWVLLIGRSDSMLQIELSLPQGIGEDGRPEDWAERIILPSIPLDGQAEAKLRGPEPGPDFDVDVTRRQA